MYVINSRRKWSSARGGWTELQTANALPPSTAPQPNYLPSGFTNPLQDPLVILIHAYSPATPSRTGSARPAWSLSPLIGLCPHARKKRKV
jgi:hypothetical protein